MSYKQEPFLISKMELDKRLPPEFMSRAELKNARVKRARLGYEDHGLLTYALDLDFDGTMQSYGNLLFSNRKEGVKVANAFGGQMIMSTLDLLEVRTWDQVSGSVCRALCDWSMIYAIGHFQKDLWLEADHVYKMLEKILGHAP